MRRCILLLILTVILGACGREEPAFNWQAASLPTNLDPQVAQGDSNLLAVEHLFRGLYRLDEQGQPVPDGCVGCVRTEEGYRLALSRQVEWWDGEPVTASDYVFGIRRSLDPDTGSPYREELSVIEDVSAEGDLTLRLTLAGDADLPRLLSCPGAYPCREDFFDSCNGQYGLTRKNTLGNGCFALQSWGTSLFTLSRVSGEGLSLLRFTLPQSSLPLSGQVLPDERGVAADTWVLALNGRDELLQNLTLRQAIGGLLRQAALPLPAGAIKATQPVPPIYCAPVSLPAPGDYLELLWATTERLGCLSLKGLTVSVCPEQIDLARALCQLLQGELGITCGIRQLAAEELSAALSRGDYSMAIFPLTAAGAEIEDFWAQCAPLCGSADPTEILESCCLVPLYHQRKKLVTAPGWAGVGYSPFTGRPDFTHAAYRP